MTNPIYDRLSKNYKGLVITGETKDDLRQDYVNQFQTDKNIQFMVGTSGAMGTGITLTAGTVVIFLDHPWNRALYDQCVDRCHRVGQKNNITIYNIMAKGTIDERIWDLVNKKGAMADALVDNVNGKISADVLEYLIG
jgi:SWI/SNF-related matrix-associated actin-dependent regulator 1 of chromatin subfamily A